MDQYNASKMEHIKKNNDYFTFMKLHYWNYSGDRQQQVLSSRTSWWPALSYHMIWTSFLSNFLLLSVEFYWTHTEIKLYIQIRQYLFTLPCVRWRSRCPHTDLILPKIPARSYLSYILSITGMTFRNRELYPLYIDGEIIWGPFCSGTHTQYSRQFGPYTYRKLATSTTNTAPINR